MLLCLHTARLKRPIHGLVRTFRKVGTKLKTVCAAPSKHHLNRNIFVCSQVYSNIRTWYLVSTLCIHYLTKQMTSLANKHKVAQTQTVPEFSWKKAMQTITKLCRRKYRPVFKHLELLTLPVPCLYLLETCLLFRSKCDQIIKSDMSFTLMKLEEN